MPAGLAILVGAMIGLLGGLTIGITIFLLLLLAVVWLLLGLFFHELGHLIFGFLTGYKFVSFQVGKWLWFKEEGKLKFYTYKLFYLGQCLMEPGGSIKEFKYFWYNFGGIFVNLLLAIACLLGILLGDVNGFWYQFFLIGILVNVTYTIMNTIPIAAWGNDGYNIFCAWRSVEARQGMYGSLVLYSGLIKGKRYRDFPPELFKVGEGVDLTKPWTATLILFEYYRLLDLDEASLALEELKRIDASKLIPRVKVGVKVELLYHYLVRDFNAHIAKELYDCEVVKDWMKRSADAFLRVRAAYTYFVIEDETEAKSLLEKAEQEAKKIPFKHVRTLELKMIKDLETLCFVKPESKIKIGSLARFFNRYQDEVEFAKRHQFDFMQLWYDNRGLVMHPDDGDLIRTINFHRFPTMIHAVLNINEFQEHIPKLLELLTQLGQTELIIHPISENEAITEDTLDKLDQSVKFALDVLTPQGITIYLENNSKLDPIFTDSYEIEKIFKQNETLEFILDIAHMDSLEHLTEMVAAKKPKMLHIADRNLNNIHEHLPIGHGEIDFEYIFNHILPDFEGKIILEIVKEDADIVESKQKIEAFLQLNEAEKNNR